MIVSQRTDTSAVEQSLPVPSCFVAEADLCRFYSRRATGVDSLAFTSDGSWLAVGRTDGQIDLYDHAAYRLIMSLPGSENASVRCLQFVSKTSSVKSDDCCSLFNFRLFSAGLHGGITEWDLKTLSPRFTSPSFGGAVFGFDVYEPLGLLVTANDDGGARLFKLRSNAGEASSSSSEDEEELLSYWKCLTKHDGRLLSLCFYDEDRLYGGTANSQIVGWSLPSGISTVKMTVDQSTKIVTSQHKRTVEKTPTLIWTLVALPRHRLIASGDSSGAVYLWSVDVHTVLKMFCPHQMDVLRLAVCPVTRNSIFSVGLDGKLSIIVSALSTAGQASQAEWILSESRHPHVSDARALAVSVHGEIATGSSDTVVAIMTDTLSCATRKRELPALSAPISSSWIHISETLRLVLAVQPSYVDLWCLLDAEHGKSLKPVKAVRIELDDEGQGWQCIRCAALSDDGTMIAVSNNTGTRLFRFDVAELTVTTVTFKKLRQRVATALHFVQCGEQQCLITATIGRVGDLKKKLKLTVWDLHTGTIVAEFAKLDSAVASIGVSMDKQWCATRSFFGRVVVYSLDKMEEVYQLPPFPFMEPPAATDTGELGLSKVPPSSSMTAAMAFSPDSKYLIAFSYQSKYFRIYATESRQCLTASNVAPRQALLTHQPAVLRVPHYSAKQDDVGRVFWTTQLEPRWGADDKPQLVTMQVMLIQTRQCLLTVKLQIFDPLETSKNSDVESFHTETPIKSYPSEKRRRQSLADDHAKSFSCRARKQKSTAVKLFKPNNGLEFLCAAFLASDKKCSGSKNTHKTDHKPESVANPLHNLLIFAQSKEVPADQLPPVFTRKRYAT